jgi:hypothetical protein
MIHSWGIVPSGGSISFIHCGNPVDGLEHTAIPCSAKVKRTKEAKITPAAMPTVSSG